MSPAAWPVKSRNSLLEQNISHRKARMVDNLTRNAINRTKLSNCKIPFSVKNRSKIEKVMYSANENGILSLSGISNYNK